MLDHYIHRPSDKPEIGNRRPELVIPGLLVSVTTWSLRTSRSGLPMAIERSSRFVKEKSEVSEINGGHTLFVRRTRRTMIESIHCTSRGIGCLPTRNPDKFWAWSNCKSFLRAQHFSLESQDRSTYQGRLMISDGTMPHTCVFCLLQVRRDLPKISTQHCNVLHWSHNSHLAEFRLVSDMAK